jgi:glycosyltransferase involved in cell wall biosynthesis
LEGYHHRFLKNVATHPGVSSFHGCNTPEIRQVIAGEAFDAFLVMGWNTRSYWQAMRACWKRRVPVMIRGDSQLGTPRPWWIRAVKAFAYRRFIPRFDAYLVVGQRAREYYLAYGAKPERMFFAPHCVDNDWFGRRAASAAERVPALRRSLGANEATTMLLFVGKLTEKKRPVDLIRAANVLGERGRDILVVYVGAGPLEGRLRKIADRHGIPCHFAGFRNQSELPEWYTTANLVILPSESETWGLVANEAMACGRPVVVSDVVGCAPDLIDEDVTGATFSVGDVGDLAKAIERVLPRINMATTRVAIQEKMKFYSIESAVEGILEAVGSIATGPGRWDQDCD